MKIEQNQRPGDNSCPTGDLNPIQERGFKEVLESLPKIIRETALFAEAPQEQQMLVYSGTVVCGSLMPEVNFQYDEITNYPNLYFCSVFPPASGKGRLALIPKLLRHIVNEQLTYNGKELKKYQVEYQLFKKKIAKGEQVQPPEKPKLKILLVPGNVTSSKLLQQLAENDGLSMTLIFETEIDAIANMMNSTYGDSNSMTFRKAYHNEPLSHMRKNDSEHLVANRPMLCIAVTGTASQLAKMIHSIEDGTFSRCLFMIGGLL